MKNTELRIGNYVMIKNELLLNYKNQPLIVTSIQQRNDRDFPNSKSVISCYLDKYNSVSQFDEFIKPIPLTEEWLLKFGKINWLYKDTHGYYTTFNNKRIYFKFVHSLQNFYFCVEQKELQ